MGFYTRQELEIKGENVTTLLNILPSFIVGLYVLKAILINVLSFGYKF